MYNQKPEYLNKTLNNIEHEIGLRNYDLKNPDTQYLRYKQLMNSQYYNLQANSTNAADPAKSHGYADMYGDTKKIYELPNRYKLHAQQREDAMKQMSV